MQAALHRHQCHLLDQQDGAVRQCVELRPAGGHDLLHQPDCCTSGALTNLLVIPTIPVTNGVCPKFITETWQISDGCGDNMTCTQVVKVVDTTAARHHLPNQHRGRGVEYQLSARHTLTFPPARRTTARRPASWCTRNRRRQARSCRRGGQLTVTVTVTDLCGNSSHCYVKIVGVDQTGPVVTCPATMTVTNCLVPCVPVTATDNCCPPSSLRITQSPPCNTPLGPGINSVTVTVTDCHGNSTTKVVQLVIIGTESFLGSLFNTGVDASKCPSWSRMAQRICTTRSGARAGRHYGLCRPNRGGDYESVGLA